MVTNEDKLPLSWNKKREIEFRLCCFVAWLRRATPQPASGTIAGYVGHVRSRHSIWLGGVAFEELVGATRRLSLITKAIKKQRPPQKRKKVPFTLEPAQEG